MPLFRSDLLEVAGLFLRLGATVFGGPAAHIAVMEDEVVRRRRWLTREAFLDYLGATNLIPGPNSTELAIHIGHARAGWPGLIVAGVCFILPATLIVGACAWAYVRFGAVPQAAGILYGVKPAVMAVVIQALWTLGRSAVKNAHLAVLGIAAIVLNAAGVHELVLLGGAAALSVAFAGSSRFRHRGGAGGFFAAAAPWGWGIAAGTPVALWPLFLIFAKTGAVLFGSGYVLLAFLRADLVERLHWLTESQLLDAIAVGQMTPGPVFTTATFVGYLLAGTPGAAVATIGIFLPAFFFVALSGPIVPWLRRSPIAGAALDGVNVASLALMAVVSWQLGHSALVDPLTVAIGLVSLGSLVWLRVSSTWLIAAAALAGWLAQAMQV